MLVTYILTLNEEGSVVNAIQSALSFSSRIVVIDGGSTDDTVRVARDLGADIFERPFDDFSSQRNWALAQVRARYAPEWIFQLDADEQVSERLASEIRAVTNETHRSDVYLVPLRIHFCGKVLLHGGFARTKLPRLFRSTAGEYESRGINEHFAPNLAARMGRLRGFLLHADVTSWERHIAKHNNYSTREALARIELESRRAPPTRTVDALRHRNVRRRWLRERLWNPLPFKPALRFIQIYVIQLGVLDGRPGLNIATFAAWQEMCIEEKVRALGRLSSPPKEISEDWPVEAK